MAFDGMALWHPLSRVPRPVVERNRYRNLRIDWTTFNISSLQSRARLTVSRLRHALADTELCGRLEGYSLADGLELIACAKAVDVELGAEWYEAMQRTDEYYVLDDDAPEATMETARSELD